MKDINWQIKHFDELSKLEVYQLIQLREQVFVVEQNCPYLDADGLDQIAFHVLGNFNDSIVATARIFPPNEVNEVVIGRICNGENFRGSGLGRELVNRCLDFAKMKWSGKIIKISAQCYLIRFYESFGFKINGEEYLEDGIPHITMTVDF